MIVLYTMKSTSPNIRKISIMLEEIGLPYVVRHVEKNEDGMFADDFTAISPNATVPAIVDEDTGISIFESTAILYYLAEKCMALPPDISARGEVIKWMTFEAANVGPVIGELYHYMVAADEEISTAQLQRYKNKLAHYCSLLEQQLRGRLYLCGEYSIADIALYPWMVVMEDMADIMLKDYPNLQVWAATISNRAAVQTDHSVQGEWRTEKS